MAKKPINDWDGLALRLSNVFQPSAPINSDKLFRGRRGQDRAVVDAINQPGRHAIIFGGRGVGKTSLGKTLANKLHAIEPTPVVSPFVTCDSSDNYSSIWRKAFIEIRYQTETDVPPPDEHDIIEDIHTQWTPYEVRRTIEPFAHQGILYVVFDEFDKVEDPDARGLRFNHIFSFVSSRQSHRPSLAVLSILPR